MKEAASGHQHRIDQLLLGNEFNCQSSALQLFWSVARNYSLIRQQHTYMYAKIILQKKADKTPHRALQMRLIMGMLISEV